MLWRRKEAQNRYYLLFNSYLNDVDEYSSDKIVRKASSKYILIIKLKFRATKINKSPFYTTYRISIYYILSISILF
jgi:hypothetical protein